jgi:hypothetical protein
MADERRLEMRAVAVAAEAALRERPPALRGLWVFVAPSFDDWRAYELWELRGEWRLRRRVWRHLVDAEKMRTPVERLRHPRPLLPTIETREIPYGASEAEAAFERLASLRLRVLPEGGGGLVLDGADHEVALEDGAASMRLRWNPTPAAWAPLAETVDVLLAAFDAALADGEP